MMYSEFVAGTGCKDNEYNYGVFKNLEVMYMNTNMTKDEIYEYGKKLVDNSKSEAELKIEAEISAEIEEQKKQIEDCKRNLEYEERMLVIWKEDGDKSMIHSTKSVIKYYKDEIRRAKNRINSLKWVLSA